MIDISPKHLAKSHSLSGLVTVGLEQMPCRPLRITYSYFTNSLTVAFNCWALSYKLLKFCLCVRNTTITGGGTKTQPSHLHKQRSSPSSTQHILKAGTASHPQVHIKSRHCPCSACYAVIEHRRGFRHRAISLASLTSTRTRFSLKQKKPVLKSCSVCVGPIHLQPVR